MPQDTNQCRQCLESVQVTWNGICQKCQEVNSKHDELIKELSKGRDNTDLESLHDRRVRLVEKGMEIYAPGLRDDIDIQKGVLTMCALDWADAVIAATKEENE